MHRDRDIYPGAVRAEMKLRRIHCRLEIAFSNVVAMQQIRAFLYIGRDKGEVLLQSRVTLPGRTDRVLEKFFRRNMIVTDEIDRAQNRLWPFGHIQHEARSALDGIVHVDFGITVFAVEELQKKCGVVGPRRRQSKIVDGCDFFLEDRTQFFFLERGGAANLEVGSLRLFLFLMFDEFVFARGLLRPLHIHCALTTQVRHARDYY